MLRRFSILAVAALAATCLNGSPATADADGPEQIPNGTFDTTTAPWWHTGNLEFALTDGRLCTDVPGGTVNPWDAIVGVNDIPLVKDETYAFSFFATGTPAKVARAYVQLPVDPYTQYVSAAPEVSVSGNAYTYTFTSPVDLPDAQVVFQLGGSAEPWRFCVDDVSLRGGAEPEVYEPDTGPRVRVNQVAYLPKGPKNATLVTDATEALPWQLKNADGETVAHGTTKPRGVDASSGQNVHSIDFGSYVKAGTDFTLTADGETSRPFDIKADAYADLKLDALKFYYTQRSGIEIDDACGPGTAGRPGTSGSPPTRATRTSPASRGVRLPARRLRRLVRRRRPRQVRRQRRHLGGPAHERVRADQERLDRQGHRRPEHPRER